MGCYALTMVSPEISWKSEASATDPVSLWRDRRLWMLLAFGALLRLVVGLDLWAHDPTMRALLSDSRYYLDWAVSLVGGSEFEFEGPGKPYWMPPLYPLMLAATGASISIMVLVQGLMGLATTALLVRFGEDLLGRGLGAHTARRAALASGLIWSLYGPVLFFETRLLGVSVALLLAVLTLGLVLRYLRAPGIGLAIAAGLAAGVLALVRPNTLLSIPAIALVMIAALKTAQCTSLRARVAPAIAFGLAALVAIAPALWKNHEAEGEWIPLTANGGINFYFGNNPASHGTFHAPGPEWGSIGGQRQTSIDLASEATGTAMSHGEASSFWFGQGRDYLVEQPGAAAKLWLLKLADCLSSTEYGIQYNIHAARAVAPSLWIAGLPFGALLFLAALGMAAVLRGKSLDRGAWLLVLAWIGAGLVSALLYFTYSRFRLPLLPALMPFAGLGMLALLSKANRPRPAALLVAAALAAVSFLPAEGDYPDHLKAHAFQDMAFAVEANAVARGATDGAAVRAEVRGFLERSLAIVPRNKTALTKMGVLYQYLDPRQALDYLERAHALPQEEPDAELWLARLLIESPTKSLRDPVRAQAILWAWLQAHPADHPRAAEFVALLAK
ncbi:MAG: 4-amino-4-deoxy-L-arabinose transferase-like glycosyltransferase [Planctomycetota bacterium]|jgi:4-amino-4-deoxy-L-arabinose transferase-like glycosyltransferase